MNVAAAFATALVSARASQDFKTVIVAVSGGGDSMALLHLAVHWAAKAGVGVRAVTVDHGLRPAAAAEAAMVADVCRTLGVEHGILNWRGWDGQGNLQSAARAARYDLIADLARDTGAVVLLGHTRDDAAETFVMRLARGSGVDGLASMRRDWHDRGLRWLRPLIDLSRADLRAWLIGRGVDWVEDPTNDDPSFARVQVRQAMAVLAPLGVDTARLVETAGAMTRARVALQAFAHRAAKESARIEGGDVVFEAIRLAALPEDIRLRLLAHALIWVASATYRPRLSALLDLDRAVKTPGKNTLAGCLVIRKGDHIHVLRELKAVAQTTAMPGTLWDRRWRILPPKGVVPLDYSLGALGETGLRACPDWRDAGGLRESLLASPAVWRGEVLVAAPLAGWPNGWVAQLEPPLGDFKGSILTH